MLNLLRMDCRRLIRSRSFYIVLAITVGTILLVSVLAMTMSTPEFLDAMEQDGAEITQEDRQAGEDIRNMSQLDFAYECLSSGFLLILTGIGMALFVNSDFSSGFIKNICFAKPRRGQYVLAKILLAGIYSGLLTALSILLSIFAPILFQLHPAPDSILSILKYTFWSWLPHWAFGLMALALVLLTRSTTLGIAMSIISGIGVPAMLVGLLGNRFAWPPIERYFLSNVVSELYVPQNGVAQIGVILACVIGWGAAYVIGSLLAMEKQDI